MIEMGIYKIINKVNGKFYIGSTNNLVKRWIQHKSKLNVRKHINPHLQSSWNKYGKDSFYFEIIEKVENEKNLLSKEQFYLDKLKPEYNINPIATKPPSAKNRIWDNESIEKIRQSLLGKKHSQERKNAIREGTLKMYEKHPEVKEKISKANTGKKRSLKQVRKHTKTMIRMRNKQPELWPIPKIVLQYSIDNKFIKEFMSAKEASNILNIGHRKIRECCGGAIESYKGFIWRYANE